MANERFYRGDLVILFIEFGGLYKPVACLTDNSLSESVESLETTTIDNGGWNTSIPTNQSYSISFSGISTPDLFDNDDKVSLYTLRSIKRVRTIFNWEIRTNNGEIVDYGTGYLSDISDSSGVGDSLQTFSGTITGYGRLFQTAPPVGFVTWDQDDITFDSTLVTWDNDETAPPIPEFIITGITNVGTSTYSIAYTVNFPFSQMNMIVLGSITPQQDFSITMPATSPIEQTVTEVAGETLTFQLTAVNTNTGFTELSNQFQIVTQNTINIISVTNAVPDTYVITFDFNFTLDSLQLNVFGDLSGLQIFNIPDPYTSPHSQVVPTVVGEADLIFTLIGDTDGISVTSNQFILYT